MSQPVRDYLGYLIRRQNELMGKAIPAFVADADKSEQENLDALVVVIAQAEILCRNFHENRDKLDIVGKTTHLCLRS